MYIARDFPMLCDLNYRFQEHVEEKKLFSRDDGLLVGVSGGLDSLVLLHLLHFDPVFAGLNIVIGHFDHGMRSQSHLDALWVKGLAQAWGIRCEIGRADYMLSSENDARIARYKFLEDTRDSLNLDWVITAHHADDQAETVLFRILRGTGVWGLNGILESRSPAILRPLLPFSRDELEEYAKRMGIQALQDPTNFDSGFARNALRNEILPQIEENVAPAARHSLIRLSQIATEHRNAWSSVLQKICADLILSSDSDRMILDRKLFLSFNDEACAIILRELCQKFAVNLSESATRSALVFSRKSQSGNRMNIGGSMSLIRSFDKLLLVKTESKLMGESFVIEVPGVGIADLTLGRKRWTTSWSTEVVLEDAWCEVFCLKQLVFPLCVRNWNPGDKITYSYGSKKLKKIFSEKKISVERRFETPVVVDAMGRTLWIPGVSRTSLFIAGKETGMFSMSVSSSVKS